MSNDVSYTSGDVARFCGVTLRTVIRWIDKGHLKAYKLPGRGNNRIRKADLMTFLASHDMPIPTELQPESGTVLVVDDDSLMAASLQRLLRRRGYTVEAVADGFQAGVALAQLRPRLLVLDLMMPGMNGFEVLTYLRRTDMYKDMKVLVCSGAGDQSLKEALDHGADAVVAKPFDNKVFSDTVDGLLQEA